MVKFLLFLDEEGKPEAELVQNEPGPAPAFVGGPARIEPLKSPRRRGRGKRGRPGGAARTGRRRIS